MLFGTTCHPLSAWEGAVVLATLAAPLCLVSLAPVLRGVTRRVRRMSAVRRVVLGVVALAATAYAGTKVVTERGIRIVRCVSDSQKTEIDWETEDSRILPGMPFLVQCSLNGFSFATVAQTTASNAVIPGFTVGDTRWWRIAVDVGEVQSEGGGE